MSKNVKVQVPVENLNHLSEALTMREWEQDIVRDTNDNITSISFNKPGHTWVKGEAVMKDDKVDIKIDHMKRSVSLFNEEIGSAYSAVKIMREVENMKNVKLSEETPFVIRPKSVSVYTQVRV